MTKFLLFLCFFSLCIAPGLAQKKKHKYETDPLAVPLLKINGPATLNISPGEKVTFTTQFAHLDFPAETLWTASGGSITPKGTSATFDSAGLPPGPYKVVAELKEGACVAYDTRVINIITAAPEPPPAPKRICFDNVTIHSSQTEVDAGEIVTFTRNALTGSNYGAITESKWMTSAGMLTGAVDTAKLDTTGIASGSTVTIAYSVSTDANCAANTSITLRVKEKPPEPVAFQIGVCDSFKANQTRVDNACKDILGNTLRSVQNDPTAKVHLVGSVTRMEAPALAVMRARNVASVLTDGSLGNQIDANRITTASGNANSRSVVIWVVPPGAKMP